MTLRVTPAPAICTVTTFAQKTTTFTKAIAKKYRSDRIGADTGIEEIGAILWKQGEGEKG